MRGRYDSALAHWLRRAPPPRALACFEREMIARAWVKVRASREACVSFHSKTAVEGPPEFAGVDPARAREFLGELDARGIGAGLGGDLEASAARVLAETVGEGGAKPYAYLKSAAGSGGGGDGTGGKTFFSSGGAQNGLHSTPATGTVFPAESLDAAASTRTRATSSRVAPVASTSEARMGGESSVALKRIKTRNGNGNGNGSGSGAAPSGDLCACVARATAAGLRALGLPPIRDAIEDAAASRLVPGVKYQRRSRPAHDWVSRAALKIVNARRNADIKAAAAAAAASCSPAAADAAADAAVDTNAGVDSELSADGAADVVADGAADGASNDDDADDLTAEMAASSVSCSTTESDGRSMNADGGVATDKGGLTTEESNERVRLRKIATKGAKKTEKETYDDAEVMALARAVVDELRRRSSGDDGIGKDGVVAAARVAPDGQILITSVARSEEMASKGLAMCAGCGQFYAVHGGGLRQHWARGGVDQACAAAAEAARSASMTDEEATAAIGRAKGSGTDAESSSWRGSGVGRPGPWRAKKSNEQRLHPGLAAAAAGDVAGMAAAAEGQSGRDRWDPVTSCDGYGSDALQWAAGGGHLAACRWLVFERGVQVAGTRRKDGRTPLHWAARNGHLEVCQWLVAQVGKMRVCVKTPTGNAMRQKRPAHRRRLFFFLRPDSSFSDCLRTVYSVLGVYPTTRERTQRFAPTTETARSTWRCGRVTGQSPVG